MTEGERWTRAPPAEQREGRYLVAWGARRRVVLRPRRGAAARHRPPRARAGRARLRALVLALLGAEASAPLAVAGPLG